MATGVLTVSDDITVQGQTEDRPFGTQVIFKDMAGKTWRCNEAKLLRAASDGRAVFSTGRHLAVEFRESQPEGQKFPSRWINEAYPAKDDEPDTFQPRAQGSYQGGGGGARPSGGNSKPKGDFRSPSEIKRSTALGVAVSFYDGKDATIEQVIETAKVFAAYLDGAFETQTIEHPAVTEAKAKLDAVEADDDDVPF